MKKKVISLTLAFLLLLGLSVPALADDEPVVPTVGGFYVVDSAAGVTVTGATAEKTDIAAVSAVLANVSADETDAYTFYPGAVQLKVTLENTDKTLQYAVFLSEGDTITEQTLKYIDQQGSGESLTFYVYPAELSGNTQLTLWITNSGGGDPVKVKLGYWVPYVLGDVDGDKEPSAVDASMILQSTVNLIKLTPTQNIAGDVNKSGSTDAEDASYILQLTVNLINSFDEIQKNG